MGQSVLTVALPSRVLTSSRLLSAGRSDLRLLSGDAFSVIDNSLRRNIRLDFPVSDLRNWNIRLDFPFPTSEIGISVWIFHFRASVKEYPFGFSSFRASPLQYHFVKSFPASSVAVPSRGFARCPGFAFHGSPLRRSHINIPTANIVIFPLIRAREIINVPPKPQFLCFFIDFRRLFH